MTSLYPAPYFERGAPPENIIQTGAGKIISGDFGAIECGHVLFEFQTI